MDFLIYVQKYNYSWDNLEVKWYFLVLSFLEIDEFP